MSSRYRSRARALQILFLLDLRKQTPDDAIRAFYGSLYSDEDEEQQPEPDSFMEELIRGTVAETVRIDEYIARHSENWRLDRMSAVDRNVLRLAVYELQQNSTAAAIVIDQALELARRFSGEESVAFVNGVLDAVRIDLEKSGTAGAVPPSSD